MKKTAKPRKNRDDLRTEYDFSQMAEEVHRMLRSVITAMPKQARDSAPRGGRKAG